MASSSVQKWIGLGFSSIVDQGLISFSNFFLSVTCAKVSGPSRYGAFVIAFSAFLFASGFHNALILEPMSVLAGPSSRNYRWSYLQAALVLHAFLSVGIAVMLGLSAWATFHSARDLSGCFVALALAGPVVLLFWLLRRACYVWLKPIHSATASLTYAIVVFAISTLLRRHALQRIWFPFAIMGAASAIACVYLGALLGRVDRSHLLALKLRTIIASHLQYAKWSTGVTLAYSLSDGAYPIILGFTCGLTPAGQFRAAENLFLPMMQVISALSLLLLPRAARGTALGKTQYLHHFLDTSIRFVGPSAALYGLGVLISAPLLSRVLYGDRFPRPAMSLLLPLAVALMLRAIYDISLATAVRSTGSSRHVFYATGLGAVLTLTCGYYFSIHASVSGAAAARLLSILAQSSLLIFFLRRVLLRNTSAAPFPLTPSGQLTRKGTV